MGLGGGDGAPMSGSSDIAQEAAAWAIRLSAEDAGEADWLAFLAWVDAASPGEADLRRAAFDRAQSVWLALDGAAPRTPFRPAAVRATRARVWAPLAAAAVLTAVLAVWTLLRPGGTTPTPPAARAPAIAYVTAVGQSRAIRLADGSRIDMDGDTALSVRLGAADRRVALARGEASFDVAHLPGRPFTVDLGVAQVRVIGTAFDIEREGAAVQVAVARGVVSLQTDGRRLRLPAGALARLDPNGSARVGRTPAADVGDWREGRRLYIDASLDRVVADLNRRYPTPIRLADDDTGRLRFTGVLVLGAQDQTIRRLTSLLSLDARMGGRGEIVLSSRRP